jgi:hypothetical protein
MNSGDHSTSYVPSQDIDFPSADGGVGNRKKWAKIPLLLIKAKVLEGADWADARLVVFTRIAREIKEPSHGVPVPGLECIVFGGGPVEK